MAAARAAETRHRPVPHGLSLLAGVARRGELSFCVSQRPRPMSSSTGFVDRFAASRRQDRARRPAGLDHRRVLHGTHLCAGASGRCDPAMTPSSAAGWSRHQDKDERVGTVCQVVATADCDWYPEHVYEGLTVAQACELAGELGP
jgi:hypothetical protein